jgi:hypothetical protein
MNKIKENAFAIATAGTAVVILAMLYFFVFQPISALGQKETELDGEIKKLEKYNDKKRELPTKKLASALEERAQSIQQSLDEGLKSYDERFAAFKLYFGDSATVGDPGTFSAKHTDEMDTAVKSYREALGIQPDPNAPAQLPEIQRSSTAGVTDEKKLAEAMREYWIAKDIIDACTKLKLPGLQKIDLTTGRAQDRQKSPYWKPIPAQVTIEMPFSQIENLLTELYASKRVSFVLETLSAFRKPETKGAYQGLEKASQFKSIEEAKSKTYDQLAPEPNLVVEIKLYAIEWIGVVQAPAEEPKKEPKE